MFCHFFDYSTNHYDCRQFVDTIFFNCMKRGTDLDFASLSKKRDRPVFYKMGSYKLGSDLGFSEL